MFSDTLPYKKKFKVIDGKRLAYVDEGDGDPIVFLHGNPTSSYLWRNVMPELAGRGRLVAPDLIGQGDSEKLPSEGPRQYGFKTAYHYLEGLLEALGCDQRVTLVIHDWGSALGFHWARQYPEAVKGIAYMEAIVMPVTWEDWPEAARGIFKGFRSEKGEDLILNRNMFVEAVLPGSVLRDLSEAEMAEYRRPFPSPESRQPTLNWPRDIPIDGEPPEMARLVRDYADWLVASPIPKLFINADPGSILIGRQREFCRSWANQTEVTVRGNHFLQEDSPVDIGRAVARWLDAIPAVSSR